MGSLEGPLHTPGSPTPYGRRQSGQSGYSEVARSAMRGHSSSLSSAGEMSSRAPTSSSAAPLDRAQLVTESATAMPPPAKPPVPTRSASGAAGDFLTPTARLPHDAALTDTPVTTAPNSPNL